MFFWPGSSASPSNLWRWASNCLILMFGCPSSKTIQKNFSWKIIFTMLLCTPDVISSHMTPSEMVSSWVTLGFQFPWQKASWKILPWKIRLLCAFDLPFWHKWTHTVTNHVFHMVLLTGEGIETSKCMRFKDEFEASWMTNSCLEWQRVKTIAECAFSPLLFCFSFWFSLC